MTERAPHEGRVPEREPLEEESLAAARIWFMKGLDAGRHCPCCERFAKRYRRKLNSGMAASLIALVQLSTKALAETVAQWTIGQPAPTGAWIAADDVGRYLKSHGAKASYPHGEMGKLVHWGLAETQGDTDGEHAKASGRWRPTPLGVEFVNRTADVQRSVVLWDNHVEGFEGERVKIDDVLNEHFSYRDLMSGLG